MVKVVTFFLIFIMVLAMIGRLRVPGIGRVGLQKPRRCPECRKFLFSNDPCDCKTGSKG